MTEILETMVYGISVIALLLAFVIVVGIVPIVAGILLLPRKKIMNMSLVAGSVFCWVFGFCVLALVSIFLYFIGSVAQAMGWFQ